MSNGDSTNKTESRLTVLDAGSIIHLDELDCLDLLENLGALSISVTVWNEVGKHRPQLTPETIAGIKIVREEAQVSSKLTTLAKTLSLDAGEISALAVLERLQGSLFLCDDAAARFAGESLGFQVRGTIGLIVRAVRRGTRTKTEVKALLEGIPEKSTLHISRDLLNRVVRELG